MLRGRVNAIGVVLLLFYTNIGAKVIASINNPTYNNPNLSIEKLVKFKSKNLNLDNWTKAPSNQEFAFRELKVAQDQVLQLKSLRTGNIYDIYKSSLVDNFSKIKDVSPDGRTVIFEVANRVAEGHVNQTYVLAFNREYGLTLADGIIHKIDHERRLTGIEFDKAHHANLIYADNKGNNHISQTVNIADDYTLTASSKVNDVKNEIVNFYGGALALGAKVQSSANPNQYEVKFNSSFTSGQVSKHRLDYDPQMKAIVLLEEINANNEVVRKTKFNYNGFNYLTETYNADGELIYCKASAGKPTIDVISNYLYLKAELEAFYFNQLPQATKVFINGNTISIDWGASKPLPLHELRFAYSFDKYSDYGFSSLVESSYDGTKKNIFIFSRNHNSQLYITQSENDLGKIALNSGSTRRRANPIN